MMATTPTPLAEVAETFIAAIERFVRAVVAMQNAARFLAEHESDDRYSGTDGQGKRFWRTESAEKDSDHYRTENRKATKEWVDALEDVRPSADELAVAFARDGVPADTIAAVLKAARQCHANNGFVADFDGVRKEWATTESVIRAAVLTRTPPPVKPASNETRPARLPPTEEVIRHVLNELRQLALRGETKVTSHTLDDMLRPFGSIYSISALGLTLRRARGVVIAAGPSA